MSTLTEHLLVVASPLTQHTGYATMPAFVRQTFADSWPGTLCTFDFVPIGLFHLSPKYSQDAGDPEHR